jgi:hypothetical protein
MLPPFVITPARPPATHLDNLQQSRNAVPNTSSWPQHALDAYHYLKNEAVQGKDGERSLAARSWGDDWFACVQGFMDFQQLAGFPVSHMRLWTK